MMRKPLISKKKVIVEEKIDRFRGYYYFFIPIVGSLDQCRLYKSMAAIGREYGVSRQSVSGSMQKVDAVSRSYKGCLVYKLRFWSEDYRVNRGKVFVHIENAGGRYVTLHKNMRSVAVYRKSHINGIRMGMLHNDVWVFRNGDYLLKFNI